MKRLALITGIVLLILTLLVIVWRLQAVVYIFLLALVITMAVQQPIDLFAMRGAPRWLAVLTIYGVAVLAIGAIAAFVLSKLTGEIDPFVQDVLTRYGLLQNRLAQLTEARREILIANLPATEDVAAMIVTNPESGIGAGLWAGAGRLLDTFAVIAMAIVVAVYWSMDSARFERLAPAASSTAYSSTLFPRSLKNGWRLCAQ
ncbi:MAG: AI-2E family transporter [Anaerolineales bacterium]|nr:AI-2E family transporter [Anaerolineales bacterium]